MLQKIIKISSLASVAILSLMNNSLAEENLLAYKTNGTNDEPYILQPLIKINPKSVDNTQNSNDSLAVDEGEAESDLKELLKERINSISYSGISNKIHSLKEVKKLYKNTGNKLLWSNNAKLSKIGYLLIQEILKAPQHALLSEAYHSNSLSSLSKGQKVVDVSSLDIIMTDAFITYKKHLTNGMLKPRRFFKDWNTKSRNIDFFSLYNQIKNSKDVASYFEVDDEDYNILKAKYNEYLSFQGNKTTRNLPNVKLAKGSRGKAVKILREKLGLNTDSNIFDESVKQALKDYQADKGLYADGVAGKNTRRSLNESYEDILEKIAINLERYRWNYIPQHSNYIWVNIPAYQMAVKNKNETIFKSDVIVGKLKRKTPIFSDTLENIVLSPYWNVPKTIFKEDKIPKLQKNANAFGSNLKAISPSGKVVSTSSVNWSNGGAGYRLRFEPGARNPLGRMKFLFPNKHAIYLHDTPKKSLFNKDNRAYSSGCVRVKRAEDLAVFLLDKVGWSKKRVIEKSKKKKETWVRLKGKLDYPVFILYLTAWVDSDKKVIFASDVYKNDSVMKKAYQKKLLSYIK